LNIEAFQSGRYSINRNLFVVVKQTGQTEQQVGIADANLFLTEQEQDLMTQTGFVKIL
jgi:phosphate transport system substrate-binding protein